MNSGMQARGNFGADPSPGVPLVKPQNAITETGKVVEIRPGIKLYQDQSMSRKSNIYPGINMIGDSIHPVIAKILTFSDQREKEAAKLKTLTPHANVACIYDADVLPSVIKNIYIVMEQCQMITLEQYYDKRKKNGIPFNTMQALRLSHQAAKGIDHIHRHGIIHRDLQPSSVLFSLDGMNLKIIDFGMTKELERGLTTMSRTTKMGSDGFRAPETYIKDEITQSSDIASLGILLTYIWSYGVHPYGSDPTLWSYNIKVSVKPDFTKLLVPDLEKAKDLLLHMLEKDPAKRFNSSQVLNHEYISRDIESTLVSDVASFYCGPILVPTVKGGNLRGGKLYHKPGETPIVQLEGDVRFELCYLPSPKMRPLVQELTRAPDGFFALSRDSYMKMLDRFKKNRQMAWMNISCENDRIGSLVLFRMRDYTDIVSLFVEDPRELVEALKIIAGPEPPKKEESKTTSEANKEKPIEEQPVEKQQEITDLSQESSLKATDLKKETAFVEPPEEEPVDPIADDDATIEQPEYLSWWVFETPKSLLESAK